MILGPHTILSQSDTTNTYGSNCVLISTNHNTNKRLAHYTLAYLLTTPSRSTKKKPIVVSSNPYAIVLCDIMIKIGSFLGTGEALIFPGPT